MEDPLSDLHYAKQPAGQPSASDLPITELGLRTRAVNVLLGAGIRTVADALAALKREGDALTRLKGFGPKSLADLKERLRIHGFRLPTEVTLPSEALETISGQAEVQAAAETAAMEAEMEEEAPQEVVTAAIEAEPEEEAPQEAAPAAATAAAAAPTAPLPASQRLSATFAQLRERLQSGVGLYGLTGALVVLFLVALFLPPLSLLQRGGLIGYTTVNAANPSISHPDGLTLSVDAGTFTDRLRVRLGSVPRLELLEGSAGKALRKAVEALPPHLVVKSPFYQTQVRGTTSQPVTIDVQVPNDADPWETLDLYTWTGEAWEWVGSELHDEVAEQEFIRARVTDIPASVVVVQAEPITQTISAYLGADDEPGAVASGVLDEVNPTGLLLGTGGDFVGDPDSLPQLAGGTVLPALRNWAPGGTVNWGLLFDMLTISEIREAHVANIVQLCAEKDLAGVELDYRGVAPGERDAYSAFVRAVADALHAEGRRLSVVVEPPAPTDGGWDTGGYDWTAIGAAADAVRVPFPGDPAAYVEGGQAQRLLDWATAQIPRYKLHMLVSSLSAERSSQDVRYISLEQAVAPFGEVVALDDITQVEPGSPVEFGLSGRLLSITPQEIGGTYRLEYEAEDGETHTVWLGTAANLAAKLRWAQRYHLGGVVVADLLDPGNAEGIADVVANYRAAAAPSPASQEPQIAWTVSSAAATIDQQVSPLTEPGYSWMVLATTGNYTVSAAVAGFDHGSVTLFVGEPVLTESITETEGITATDEITFDVTVATRDVETETLACLDASYVADVTIPDNTQLDNEEEFEKTWRVRNSGSCAWPEDTVLAFASGAQMDAPASVDVGAVEPGDQVDVSAKMKAPADSGRYTGAWRMRTADGPFGTNLTVVIQAGEVAQAATSTTYTPVSGGSFELGGHVRDTGYPYGDKMHYAGMNWGKVQVHYGQDASGIIAASHANGFKIQLSALGSADMVTKSGFEQNFANWVAGLAAAGADAIEIWNEPNIDREWQIGHISPQAYTNLLCASYQAIKAANANTMVISAAPAPTGWFGGCSPNGCDDAPWIAGLRDAGAANCMDYLGAHHNAGATSPSARSGHPADQSGHHSWYFLPQTEMYYNAFGGARKLFYTEMGYASQEGVPEFSDSFGWARGTNNAQQAAWLAEAVQLSVNTGMVRCIIVWNIDFVRYGYDPQDGYAIIRPGGSCPACDTLHNVLGTR